MNRRGFFSRVLAVLAVGPLARLLPAQNKFVVSAKDITRITHAYWLEHGTATGDALVGLAELVKSGPGPMMVHRSTHDFWRKGRCS